MKKILVTPAQAATWLRKTVANRPVSQATVAKYADDMRLGRWKYTGDTIKFDDAGNLMDGQHRLHAVVASKKEIVFAVVNEIEPQAFSCIDIGRSRKCGDLIGIYEAKTGNPISGSLSSSFAGAIRYLWQIRRINLVSERLLPEIRRQEAPSLEVWDGIRLEMFNAEKAVNPRSEEQDKSTSWIAASIRISLCFLFNRQDRVLSTNFWRDMTSRKSEDSIIVMLKQTLTAELAHKIHLETGEMAMRFRVGAWIIHAWNKKRRGAEISTLKGFSRGFKESLAKRPMLL